MTEPVDVERMQKMYDASTQTLLRFDERVRCAAIYAGEPVNCFDDLEQREVAAYVEFQIRDPQKMANWEFFAESHNAMPALLAELRSLRAAVAEKDAEIERLKDDLRLWKPMTPEEAEKMMAEVDADPISDAEIDAIAKRVTDPAERMNNREEMQVGRKILALKLHCAIRDQQLADRDRQIERMREALKKIRRAFATKYNAKEIAIIDAVIGPADPDEELAAIDAALKGTSDA